MRLFPKAEFAKRVLDIGCGTGSWSIDYGEPTRLPLFSLMAANALVADAHPEAEVTGVDLSLIQPTLWVLPLPYPMMAPGGACLKVL